jgi:hypothetical protein
VNVEDLKDDELGYLVVKCVQEQTRRAIARLDETVEEDDLWPTPVFEAALQVFGNAVYGQGKVRKALSRRISFAYGVWRDKYGPFSAEQEEYAAEVLTAAIKAGGRAANGNAPYALVYSRLLDAVNHETVHGGFLKRSGAVQRDLQTPGMREVE